MSLYSLQHIYDQSDCKPNICVKKYSILHTYLMNINIIFIIFWKKLPTSISELNFIGKLCNDLRFESTIISRKWGSEKLIRRQFAGLIDLTRTSFHPSLWQGNYQSRVPNILQLKKTVQKPLSPLKTICLEPLKFKVLPVHYTK